MESYCALKHIAWNCLCALSNFTCHLHKKALPLSYLSSMTDVLLTQKNGNGFFIGKAISLLDIFFPASPLLYFRSFLYINRRTLTSEGNGEIDMSGISKFRAFFNYFNLFDMSNVSAWATFSIFMEINQSNENTF